MAAITNRKLKNSFPWRCSQAEIPNRLLTMFTALSDELIKR